jgi:hypothetical protein
LQISINNVGGSHCLNRQKLPRHDAAPTAPNLVDSGLFKFDGGFGIFGFVKPTTFRSDQ